MEFIKTFKSENDWMIRLNRAKEMIKKYPNRIPIIVDRGTRDTPKITRHKFLVPHHHQQAGVHRPLLVGDFLFILRNYITLEPHQAIYIFVGDRETIPATADFMSRLYEQYQDRDGFLYITYTLQSTFG